MIRIHRRTAGLATVLLLGLIAVVAMLIGVSPVAAQSEPPAELCELDGKPWGVALDISVEAVNDIWAKYNCGTFSGTSGTCLYLHHVEDGYEVYWRITAHCDDLIGYTCDSLVVYEIPACRGGSSGSADSASDSPPDSAPPSFLSDVCEPYDGFSSDGWMTINTSALEAGAIPRLYYAASQDGPWLTLEASGPPWVLNEANLTAMAAAAGAASYHDLWIKGAESGMPNHLGNMILERDGRMDELCN